MADLQSTQKVLPPYCNSDLDPKQPALASGTNNPTLFPSAYGGKDARYVVENGVRNINVP